MRRPLQVIAVLLAIAASCQIAFGQTTKPFDWSGVYVGPQGGSSLPIGSAQFGAACPSPTLEPGAAHVGRFPQAAVGGGSSSCVSPTPTPSPTPPPEDDYARIRQGRRSAQSDPVALAISTLSLNGGQGAVGGGLIGYNFQFGSLVVGPEADYGTRWTGGSTSTTTSAFTAGLTQSWFARARARVGYAYENWLFFVAGGYSEGNFGVTLTAPGEYASGNQTFTGYNYGGGVEYAFSRNLIGRAEYVLDAYSNATFTPSNSFFSPTPFTNVGDVNFRAALTYKF